MNFQQYPAIILASRSPRRQQLLTQIGIKYDLLDVEIDESVNVAEAPISYVERMARQKAQTAWQSEAIKSLSNYQERALLAADTSVVFSNTILGKPADVNDAIKMLSELSGNTHQVITAVALLNKQTLNIQTSVTQVTFAKLSATKIADYCRTEEGLDKAGAYAIQGLAAQFVKSIEGSYSGVVGLPLYETSVLVESYYSGL